MLYMPSMPTQLSEENPYGYQLPSDRSALKNFKTVEIKGEDRPTLKGWFIKSPTKGLSGRTIVFMHENAGNLGLRMDWFLRVIGALDVNILTFAYRGYSDSEGSPSEVGLKQDGLDIMHYVKNNLDDLVQEDGGIFLLGRSLGGAVAAYTASHVDTPKDLFSGLILESTFTSIPDMVDAMFPYPTNLVTRLLCTIGWKTIDIVKDLNIPVLYITGSEDELVPT
jgi:fermentation-respiration switch protein FrsA (DUF1100 family)